MEPTTTQAAAIAPEVLEAIKYAVKEAHANFVYGNALFNTGLIGVSGIVLWYLIRMMINNFQNSVKELWHHTTAHGHQVDCDGEGCKPEVRTGKVISPPYS